MMEAPVDLDMVSEEFGLGELEVVEHHFGATGAWQLADSNGQYALKAQLADAPAWQLEGLSTSSRLEMGAWEAGVGMPRPLVPRHPRLGRCARVEEQYVWLNEWVPGRKCTERDDVDRWLGSTLATLHRIEPSDRDVDASYGLHPHDEWAEWIVDGARQELGWAWAASEHRDAIREATLLVAQVEHGAEGGALCHRDISMDNVLVTPQGFALCDWGYAGVDVPWYEAVAAAASFGAPRPKVLETYLEAGGRRGTLKEVALARWVGGTLNWLAFNMWVSLGHRTQDSGRRKDATEQVPIIITDLVRKMSSLDDVRQALLEPLR